MGTMKILRIVLNGIMGIIFLFGILIIVMFALGLVPTIVSSGSMSGTLEIGDLCFISKRYPYEKIKKGDIIVYQLPKQKVIHRVINQSEEGLTTKGDANANPDTKKTTQSNYYGKYVFSIPRVGLLISKMQTVIGKTIAVTCILVLYVVTYLVNYACKKKESDLSGDK